MEKRRSGTTESDYTALRASVKDLTTVQGIDAAGTVASPSAGSLWAARLETL